jgi:hypothetical protein
MFGGKQNKQTKKGVNNTKKSDNSNVNDEYQNEENQNKSNKKGFTLTDNYISKNRINRHACDCQAARHKLIANCLKCGRIVCEEEGSGPCYFCGNLVCTRQEQEKINRGSNKGEKLKAELLGKNWSDLDNISQNLANFKMITDDTQTIQKVDQSQLQKAIDHKNKLIDFDRTRFFFI